MKYIWVIDKVWGQNSWILLKFFYFCVFMGRDEVEVHKRPKYPAILTEQTWSIRDLLYGFRGNYSCWIQQLVLSEQDGSIRMSTTTEPHRKCVAHDEKSKFFMFFPEVAYGNPRNVVCFFSWNIFYGYGPTSGQKHAKLIFEEFTSLLRPILLLWVNFQGNDEPLKIT